MHLPSGSFSRRALLAGSLGAAGIAILGACGASPPPAAPPESRATDAARASAPDATVASRVIPTGPASSAAAKSATTPRPTVTSSGGSGTPSFRDVTLQVWIFGNTGTETNSEALTTRQIIDAFNAYYTGRIRAEVNPIANPDTEFGVKITSAALAQQLPDLFQFDGPNVASYAYGKILRPLDDLFPRDELSDFVPSILEQGTWRDRLWALGAFSSSIAVMVNTRLASAAGLAPPDTVDNAWDWKTFVAAARSLTKGNQRGLDLHFDYGVSEWFTYLMLPFIWSNGGDVLSPDHATATGYLNGNATVDVLTEFQTLFRDGVISATPDPKAFEKGSVGLQINGGWVIEGFKDFPDLQWTMMPLPYFKEKVSPSGSYCWGISQQTRQPAAAAELLRWLVGVKTGIVPIVNTNRLPPARESAYPLIPFYGQFPYRLYGEQLRRTARARPVTPVYPFLSAKFAEAVNDIALGRPVPATLDRVASAVDSEIRRNARYAT